MLGSMKRIVARPLRRKVENWVDETPLPGRIAALEQQVAVCLAAIRELCEHNEHRFAERQSLAQRLDATGAQIDEVHQMAQYLRSWVLALQPEIVQPSDEGRRQAAEIMARYGVDLAEINTSVSRHDVMFQYMASLFGRNSESIDRAFLKYFRSGLHMQQVLDAIVRRQFGSYSALGSFLDFAGGHGRLTRFLVKRLDPARIWVSDIKADGVEFQKAQFGVNGFPSTVEPEDLEVRERFELIFVGSLFSHLPERTFERWLRRLWGMLAPTGLLVFTANNAAILNAPDQAFSYVAFSEETIVGTTDRALDTEQYGTTAATEECVRAMIGRLDPAPARYAWYPRGLWGRQDVYLIARAGPDLTGLSLPAQI